MVLVYIFYIINKYKYFYCAILNYFFFFTVSNWLAIIFAFVIICYSENQRLNGETRFSPDLQNAFLKNLLHRQWCVAAKCQRCKAAHVTNRIQTAVTAAVALVAEMEAVVIFGQWQEKFSFGHWWGFKRTSV